MPIEIEIIDNSLPKVCLNMIVKNESRIILRLLESVAPVIDAYCICDTGSTDNTVELLSKRNNDKFKLLIVGFKLII